MCMYASCLIILFILQRLAERNPETISPPFVEKRKIEYKFSLGDVQVLRNAIWGEGGSCKTLRCVTGAGGGFEQRVT